MRRSRLSIVPEPAEAPTDITLAIRDDIAKRDWSRVMIEADRRKPFAISRWWRA